MSEQSRRGGPLVFIAQGNRCVAGGFYFFAVFRQFLDCGRPVIDAAFIKNRSVVEADTVQRDLVEDAADLLFVSGIREDVIFVLVFPFRIRVQKRPDGLDESFVDQGRKKIALGKPDVGDSSPAIIIFSNSG